MPKSFEKMPTIEPGMSQEQKKGEIAEKEETKLKTEKRESVINLVVGQEKYPGEKEDTLRQWKKYFEQPDKKLKRESGRKVQQ